MRRTNEKRAKRRKRKTAFQKAMEKDISPKLLKAVSGASNKFYEIGRDEIYRRLAANEPLLDTPAPADPS